MFTMTKFAEDNLRSFLDNFKSFDIPGVSLLICHKDQEVFRHYSGTVRENTIFRIYSMSKVVTVTAALQLYELGKFVMDDPLSKFLPEFKEMTVWDTEKQQEVPAQNAITMRDLFCMSAGFSYDGDYDEPARRVAKLKMEMEQKYPGESYTTQQFVRALANLPLAFEPGTHWRYSLCHDVLGAVIEVISGQTLGEYMEEHIFRPLGMEHTFFRCPKELWHWMADCTTGTLNDDKFKENAHYEAGGAGLLSTLDDSMIFAKVLTRGGTSENGVRIIGEKTLDLMRQDHLHAAQKEDFNWEFLRGYSYGLGVRTMQDTVRAKTPGSIGEFGWCGMLGTWMLMDPEEELTAICMYQRMPNMEQYVQTHLRTMIYAML